MQTIIHDPENTQRVEKIWAVVSRDEKGFEGIVSIPSEFGMLPLIASDEKNKDMIIKAGKQLKPLTDKKICLIELSSRTELGDL